jgi:hypothetical protein
LQRNRFGVDPCAEQTLEALAEVLRPCKCCESVAGDE